MRFVALLLSSVLFLAALAVRAEQEDEGDVEVRRVFLPADRLATELERARQGLLVAVPRAEFEDRLRRFREGRKAEADSVPRLVSARYPRIRLHEDPAQRGEAHLNGSAEWTVLFRGTPPGILPLQPLTLALQKLRFENRSALAGDFDGEQAGLLLDQPGKHILLFDWTARGEHTPEGILFEFRAPSAPLAQLEIDLPAARNLSVSPEGSQVEEEKSDLAGHRLWKVRFAGRSSLYLLVSHAAHPAQGPAVEPAGPFVIDQVRSSHQLSPGGESSEFTFDVRVSSRGQSSLTFACDLPLKPYQAGLGTGDTARLSRWEFQEGTLPRGRSALILHFREPLTGLIHPRLYFHAPYAFPRGEMPRPPRVGLSWTCPRVELQPGNLIPRSESIELRVPPQVWLEQWQPGEYRVISADTAPDGTRLLTLGSTGLLTGATARPHALIRSTGADYLARTLAWWQLEAAEARLDVKIDLEIRHGRLFEVPVWLSPGWEVETVSCSAPAERLRNWTVKPAPEGVLTSVKGGQFLIAEFQPPLETQARGEKPPFLTMRLRDRTARPRTGVLPLPGVLPIDAAGQEGGLALDWPADLAEGIVLETAAGPAEKPRELPRTQGEFPAEGPWGTHLPRRYVAWRGQPVRGDLWLRPRPVQSRKHSLNEIRLRTGSIDLSAQLTVEPVSGAVDSIEVRLAAPLPGRSPPRLRIVGEKEKDSLRVRGLEQMHGREAAGVTGLLAATRPLQLASLLGSEHQAQHWRVLLNRPLRSREPLTLSMQTTLRADRAIDGQSSSWPVPLLTFPGTALGEVVLVAEDGASLAGAVEQTGLRSTFAAENPSRRTYRHDEGFISLGLRAQSGTALGRKTVPGAGAVLPRAELLTRVDRDRRLVTLFTFEVRDWAQSTLPVRLPPGATLAALRIDGREVSGFTALAEGSHCESNRLDLPVPHRQTKGGRNLSSHHFELLYTVERESGWLVTRLESPVPETPLEPLSLRRVWRFPSSLTPVSPERLLRMPGGAGSGLAAWAFRDNLPGWTALVPRALGSDRWAVQQEQAVRLADLRFRRAAAGQSHSLGEALRQISSPGLTEQGMTLVVDAAALADAGLHPDRIVQLALGGEEDPTGPLLSSLAGLDLVCVPSKAAPLVTTRRQALAWQRIAVGGEDGDAPLPVLQALADALQNGHDVSGRFRTIPAWVETPLLPADPDRTLHAPALEDLTPADEMAGWTDWLVTPDAGNGLWVVPARVPAGVGGALAVVLLALAWRVRVRARREGTPRTNARGSLALLLVWLAVAGLGVLWLPTGLRDLAWWPLAGGIVVALVWYLTPSGNGRGVREASRGSSGRHKTVAGILPAVGVLVGFGLTWSGGPAAPPLSPEATVYLLPTRDDKETPTVLVPPALLRKLDRRPVVKPLAEAILTGAEYQATRRPGSNFVEIEAVFQIHCSGTEPVTLPLPLDGVEMERAPLLDGAPGDLAALSRGYSMRIRGAGNHKLQIAFRVPFTRNGEQADLRFTAPRIAQSRLLLRLPGKGLHLQSLVHLGSQRMTEDEKGSQLEVELGAVTLAGPRRPESDRSMPLHLRWTESVRGKSVPMQFREAYLWDLGQRGNSLTGILQFDIGPGATERVTIDLPAELVVSRLEVSRPRRVGPRPDIDVGPVRIRDWGVTANPKGPPRLNVEFQTPVSGGVQILLGCSPQAHLFGPGKPGTTQAATLILPVPRPHGKPVPEGGFLAYRLSGLVADHGQVLRLAGHEVKLFPEFFWQAAGGRDVPPAYACRILREGDQGPVLPLTLRAVAARRISNVHAIWRVGSRVADLSSTLDLQAPDGDLAFVECGVPGGVEVAAVSGPDVREWSSVTVPGGGQRLQIWLQKTVRQTKVEIRGRAAIARLGLPERAWSGAGATLSTALQRTVSQAGVFSLPVLKVAGLERTTLEIVAADGLTLTTQGLRQLGPAAPPGPLERWQFSTSSEDHGGRFVVAPARQPSVRATAFVDITDRDLSLRLNLEPASGEESLRSFQLEVRGWANSVFQVDAAGARIRQEVRGQGVVPVWEIRREAADRRGVTLVGKVPLDEARVHARRGGGGLRLPEVILDGVRCAEHWLVLEGQSARFQVRTEGAPAVEVTADSGLAELERARQAGGRVWRLPVNCGDVSLNEPVGGKAGVKILAREHLAAVLDERRWTYRSVWWLWHDGPTELGFILPAGSRLLGTTIDGVEQSSGGNRPGAVSLPGSGARQVVLRWVVADARSDVATPSLETPRLPGEVGNEAIVRVLHVPPGFQAASGGGFRSGAAAAARTELERAAGQVRLAESLLGALSSHPSRIEAPVAESQLTACQQRLAQLLWNAGEFIASAASSIAEGERTDLLEGRQALREQLAALYRLHHREMPRLEPGGGTRMGDGDDLARTGRPLYRIDQRRSGAVPAVRLVSGASLGWRQSLATTGLLVSFLLGVWVLSSFSSLTRLAQRLWPEQAVLLSLLGLQLFGPNWPVIFLLALGAAVRLLLLGAGLLSMMQRWRQPQHA